MSEQLSVVAEEKAKGENDRFLAFTLGKEEYAVPLVKVKEVIALSEVRAVPNTPTHFKGIMNLRDLVISVFDLRLKLKFAKAESGPETSIIILDIQDLSIGVIVDSVDSVMAVDAADLQPPPDIEGRNETKFVTGVIRKGKRLVLLLDVERTLNVEEIKAARKQSA